MWALILFCTGNCALSMAPKSVLLFESQAQCETQKGKLADKGGPIFDEHGKRLPVVSYAICIPAYRE